jgi:formylglycine-generating enzyme required for sulfatase activity
VNRRGVVLATIAAIAVIGAIAVVGRRSDGGTPCGSGFVRSGARCLVAAGAPCPVPLVPSARGCEAPEHEVVTVPATVVVVGPADWEAEGRVKPRTVRVEAFAIDRLEVSFGRFCASTPGAPSCAEHERDPARAVFGVPFERARDHCRARGGRLPTDDEWLAAAGGERPRRYPWGDTGAVCRRAAWGLESGPCGEGAGGPDTVGSHTEGKTPLGIEDLAGNVAEWVDDPACSDCSHVVRGGSWRTTLATELRTWLRSEVSSEVAARGDPTIGFRCAYAPR